MSVTVGSEQYYSLGLATFIQLQREDPGAKYSNNSDGLIGLHNVKSVIENDEPLSDQLIGVAGDSRANAMAFLNIMEAALESGNYGPYLDINEFQDALTKHALETYKNLIPPRPKLPTY